MTERSGRLSTMLWLRAIVFSVLVPGVVAVWVPQRLLGTAGLHTGFYRVGWLAVAAGAAIYLWCLLSFLEAHGTPAIFFTRPLRALLGEEPQSLVRGGMYRYSRNPMYVGVLMVVFGQAIVYASGPVALYGFEHYRSEVPRWIRLPGGSRT